MEHEFGMTIAADQRAYNVGLVLETAIDLVRKLEGPALGLEQLLAVLSTAQDSVVRLTNDLEDAALGRERLCEPATP